MPNPFNQKPEQHATGARLETEAVTNSELYCEFCGGMSDEGTYIPQAKRLQWICDVCGADNVIRNFEL